MDFSTDRLVATVEDLRSRPVSASLLSLFFPRIIEETSEEIHFDTENKPRRIAPFVHPRSEAKPFEEEGFTTNSFKPAYVKPITTWDANRPLQRVMGEPLTGALSPDARMQMLLSEVLMDQIKAIRRRKEWMAAQALTLGQVTVTGDGYPSVVVDFQRDAALTIDLSGGAAEWDDAGVSPVEDLEDWTALVLQKSGAAPTDVIFTPGAYRLFRADSNFDKVVDLRRGGSGEIDFSPRIEAGLVGPFGTRDGFQRLWLYYDWYKDPDTGSEVPMIPDNTVILGSAAVEGRQVHGAIRDHTVGLRAMEFAPKSWTEENPSERFLMTQSAPLVVPFRANASLAATVT